ncbi:MAG: LysR family transcriptional regulator [Pseudomonadota bacterium]
MDIETLRAALGVAQMGSFAAVARSTGCDPSLVSRQISNLEARLNTRLFERSTRQLRITSAGQQFLDRVGPLVEELDAALEQVSQDATAVAGRVRLTTSVAFGQEVLVPLLAAFNAMHPNINLDLQLTDTSLDLIADNIDLAIRLGGAPRGDLIATKLVPTRYRVCASPSWAREMHTGPSPTYLSNVQCLRQDLPEFDRQWRFRDRAGRITPVAVTGPFVISSPLALRTAAKDGLGPALLADWLVDADVKSGALIDLFPSHDVTATEFETAAWLQFPSKRLQPLRTRVVIDFLKSQLRSADTAPS